MLTENGTADTAKPKNKRGKNVPPAHVPAVARWALRIGGGLALLCGALLSFFALFGLAVLNGWPRVIAWALPGCVDVLTATAAIVAMSVPRHHRGARIAHWCAGVSLAITVGCNVEYHALLPAHWTTGHIFLVATGAVPAIVVELIIVMQMYLGDGAALANTDQAATVQPKQQPSKNIATGQPSKAAETVQTNGQPSVTAAANGHALVQSAAPSSVRVDGAASTPAVTDGQDELIAEIGRTVYERLKNELGKRPPEQAFCDALAEACSPHVAAGRLSETYKNPSISTAKRVRKEIEERFPELSPLHLVTAKAS